MDLELECIRPERTYHHAHVSNTKDWNWSWELKFGVRLCFGIPTSNLHTLSLTIVYLLKSVQLTIFLLLPPIPQYILYYKYVPI